MDTKQTLWHRGIATLILGALAFGFTSQAAALAIYQGFAELELTLTSVTLTDGTPVTSGWAVEFDGYVFDQDAVASGDASASETAIVPGFGSMSAGDTLVQSAMVSGSATNGVAESFAFTALDVFVSNFLLEDLTFMFSYSASLAASVTAVSASDDAFVYVLLDLLDDFGLIDVLLYVQADALFGPLDASDGIVDMVSFTLAPGGTNTISAGFIDTFGFAEASAVPEPSTIALLLLGLAGLGSARWRGPALR